MSLVRWFVGLPQRYMPSGALGLNLTIVVALCGSTTCVAVSQEDPRQAVLMPALPEPADLVSAHEFTIVDPNPKGMALFGGQMRMMKPGAGGENQARLLIGRSRQVLEFTLNDAGEWAQTSVIPAPDDCANPGSFGMNLDCDGAYLGLRPITVREKAAVYIYKRTARGWDMIQQVRASDLPEGERFRLKVAMGDGLLCLYGREGVAIFRRLDDGLYHYETTLRAAEKVDQERFGRFVAIDGDRLAVALFRRSGASEAVELFERDREGSWQRIGRLGPRDEMPGSWFGEEIILDGDELFIASPRWESNAGRVDVYRSEPAGTWKHVQGLEVRPDSLSSFGTGLAKDGDVLLVAASMPQAPGSAYAFRQDSDGMYVRTCMIGRPNGTRYDGFATQIVVLGDQVLSSSPNEQHDGVGRAGVVRGFALPPVVASNE